MGKKGIKEICDNTGRTHFPKGHHPWNKGKKGLVNSGGFKKGHPKIPNSGCKKGCISWSKGKHICFNTGKTHFKKGEHSSPKTEFKKGITTWNKGKKFPEYSGKNNPNWKGGKSHTNEYLIICIKKKWILEHRYIMEQYLKRPLKSTEHIHHINGIKTDNRIENLMLFTSNSEHRKFHNLQKS